MVKRLLRVRSLFIKEGAEHQSTAHKTLQLRFLGACSNLINRLHLSLDSTAKDSP